MNRRLPRLIARTLRITVAGYDLTSEALVALINRAGNACDGLAGRAEAYADHLDPPRTALREPRQEPESWEEMARLINGPPLLGPAFFDPPHPSAKSLR